MERRREGSLKELMDKVAFLKEQIAKLGQINPNADEEYRRAVEKTQFFTKQCDDLLEAKQKLQTVVSEIDTAMAKQFGQAFKEIGEHFQRIFTRLFGGGSAELLLTDAHTILNAGVDIVIQPPGKKQQQLTLLSGGERALTVIALLFAFLAYHPAPFCLVDEVDAALDEANVERLARYIKNYSGCTQFIVITHRRRTMEAANTLQGVTMPHSLDCQDRVTILVLASTRRRSGSITSSGLWGSEGSMARISRMWTRWPWSRTWSCAGWARPEAWDGPTRSSCPAAATPWPIWPACALRGWPRPLSNWPGKGKPRWWDCAPDCKCSARRCAIRSIWSRTGAWRRDWDCLPWPRNSRPKRPWP